MAPTTLTTDSSQIANWWNGHGVTNPGHVRKFKLRPVSQEEATRLLGFNAPAGGFLIPYFGFDGKATGFFRIRFDDYFDSWAKALGTKPMRYAQKVHSGMAAYFPPLLDWRKIASDKNCPLIFTEGEAKGACASAHGFPSIGLGGVASWRGTKLGQPLLPELMQIAFDGRDVSVIFDSDAATNPDVLREENLLASALVNLDARVKIIRLPNGSRTKQGLDDFIVGAGAEALGHLVTGTEEWVLSREQHELDAKYIFVRETSMIAELPSPAVSTVRLHSPRVFVDALEANRTVKVDGKTLSAAKVWLRSTNRPQVERVGYKPGDSLIVNNELNLWQGWGCEPKDGDVTPALELLMLLVPKDQRQWAVQWLAYPLHHPGAKLSTCMVLLSQTQGLGKSSLAQIMRAIYGPANCSTIDQDSLDSAFNTAFHAKQLVIGEEVAGGQGRKLADKLKHLITGEVIRVNQKFQPVIELPNVANLLFLTNHLDAFHLSDGDRRFAVLESHEQPRDAKFYNELHRWLADKGAAHFFGHLLRQDLAGFNPHGHAPASEAKAVMIDASRSVLGAWVHDLRVGPDATVIHSHSHHRKILSLHTADELLTMFDGGLGRCTAKAMTLALRAEAFRLAYDGGDGQVKISSDLKVRLWAVRNVKAIARMKHDEIAALYRRERRLPETQKRRRSKFSVLEGGKAAAQ